MNNRQLSIQALLITALLFSLSLCAWAQPSDTVNSPKPAKGGIYLYNQRLDQQAQQVQKMAADVTNSQLLDAELANLDNLSQYSAERIFSSARRAAMTTLNSIIVWDQMKTRVKNWQDTLLTVKPEDWTAAQAALKKQIDISQSEIKALKDALAQAGKVPPILEDFSSASDADDFFGFAHDLVAKEAGGMDGVTTVDVRVAKRLTGTVAKVASILKELYNPANIATSSAAVRDMKLNLLKAELQHITAEARIQARREAAFSDIRRLATSVSEAIACLQNGTTVAGRVCLPSLANRAPINLAADHAAKDPEQIQNTLRRFVRRAVVARQAADACLNAQLGGAAQDCFNVDTAASDEKQKLQYIVYALQNWSALTARVATPSRLASARLAQEERRYSIQRDAIMARSYEAIVGTGAQRLAAYYKGGLKPETLAQFVQALSTASLIPTIALK